MADARGIDLADARERSVGVDELRRRDEGRHSAHGAPTLAGTPVVVKAWTMQVSSCSCVHNRAHRRMMPHPHDASRSRPPAMQRRVNCWRSRAFA